MTTSYFRARARRQWCVKAPALVSPANRATTSRSAKSAARDIVATGTLHLSVRARGLSSVVDHLESLAAGFGGYVGKSDVVESGRNVGGTLLLDVPASSFQSLIDRARRTATVRSLTTSDQDVTGQVIDLGAQLTALQDERSQLEVLLSKSAKVSDLLQVEDQIESCSIPDPTDPRRTACPFPASGILRPDGSPRRAGRCTPQGIEHRFRPRMARHDLEFRERREGPRFGSR